jgi:hypothetical protein
MTATHTCPTIPTIDPDFPPAGPLRCLNCGEELRITCGNEGCPPPLGPRNQVASRAGKPMGPRTYKPKPCAGCPKEFQPTGPRDTLCPDCKAKR